MPIPGSRRACPLPPAAPSSRPCSATPPRPERAGTRFALLAAARPATVACHYAGIVTTGEARRDAGTTAYDRQPRRRDTTLSGDPLLEVRRTSSSTSRSERALASAPSARCTPSTASTSTFTRARRSAWSASRAAASRPSGAPCCGCFEPTSGTISLDGARSTATALRDAPGPPPARRSCSRTLTRR